MSQFMRDYPKGIKKLIRQYAAKANEIELSRELQALSCKFDDWKQGEINSFELKNFVHEFHSGAARDLFNRYNNAPLDMLLAHAIVTGVMNQSEVPDEVIHHRNNAIQFYQAQMSNP